MQPDPPAFARLDRPSLARSGGAAKIVPNYLEAVPDRNAAVKGFALMRRIMATEPMKSRIVRERLPGPDCVTEDDILDHVRNTAQSQHHWAGTCKMGDDPMAVVDDRLRVHGVEGLRVIDASVMPTDFRRQHQRADHHDRRKRRGYDQGPRRSLSLLAPSSTYLPVRS